MFFNIKCSTFARLASICNYFEPTIDDELRAQLNTVRLENIDGKTLAIACNNKIMAVELVNSDPSLVNGVAHVVLDSALIQQCQAEAFLDGTLTINTVPEIATGMAQTSSGWQMQGNACYWFDETPLDGWNNLPSSKALKSSKGIMYWNLYHVEALLKSSPTGKIVFPEFIDANSAIILRDIGNDNWRGVYIPKPQGETISQEATFPQWWK